MREWRVNVEMWVRCRVVYCETVPKPRWFQTKYFDCPLVTPDGILDGSSVVTIIIKIDANSGIKQSLAIEE